MVVKSRCVVVFIVAVVLFLCTPTFSIGQQFGASAKVGIISSDFCGDHWEVPYWASKTGLCASGTVSLRFARFLEVQSGITYAQKGAEIVYVYDDFVYYTFHLDYMEVPILLKIILPLNSPVLPYIFGGSFYAKLIDDKLTVRASSGTDEYPLENIRENEYGYIVGGGVEFPIGFGKILGEVQYHRSLISFLDIEDGDMDVMNCGFSFMVGFGL